MTRVQTTIHEEEIEGDRGFVEGLRITCDRCGHYVDVGGTGASSALRGASTLREECPSLEKNFYVANWS